MKSILIVNAQIINEGQSKEGDVFIRNGRIEQIGANLSARNAEVLIDAEGKALVPGMIDDQVHFRDPGFPLKADIHSESKAALVGGITSFMDMPNTCPQTVSIEALEAKYQLAKSRSLTNYAFYLGATNDNIDVIRALDPTAACGIKVFMGASTGNMLVDDLDMLDLIFAQAPTLIATHCEDTPTILENERRYRKQFGNHIPVKFHPLIRSEEACFRSSSLAVELAHKYAARLHVLHITTARELSHFSSGVVDHKRITAEACVHHLYFDAADYREKGALIKCNPAIKSHQDREALVSALRDGKIDVIGTDHAPHTLAEKAHSYFQAPSGLPLVQHALPALLELYHNGTLGLELIVEKTSHAVAQCFKVKERGYIREGYWADLVLINLHKPFTVRREDVLHKCGWSPFEGCTFLSSVETTIVSGQVAYHHGRLDEAVRGERLQFERDTR